MLRMALGVDQVWKPDDDVSGAPECGQHIAPRTGRIDTSYLAVLPNASTAAPAQSLGRESAHATEGLTPIGAP